MCAMKGAVFRASNGLPPNSQIPYAFADAFPEHERSDCPARLRIGEVASYEVGNAQQCILHTHRPADHRLTLE
jgi:hypothetical protein